MAESFPMNGGDGAYSYTKNSYYQRAASSIAQTIIEENISEKLDVRRLMGNTSNTFRIADLGCSVGPNTFFAMQNVIGAVEKKCQSQGIRIQDLEFQVFFNDHATNDFNTLFSSLPPSRKYWAAGVPGSFYGRLFPESSLHVIHSSTALHWLSKLPEEVLDKNSPAWNKGNIHYGSASDEVANAYAAQFSKDMAIFLSARAKEMVAGGMMVLIMLGLPDEIHRSMVLSGVLTDFLGSNLMDMVNEGLIEEAQVDSFNLPVYIPTKQEMTEAIERNGYFSIERMEIRDPINETKAPVDARNLMLHLRAVSESVYLKHFGTEVTNELFDRALRKCSEISGQIESSYKKASQLFVVLERK